MLCRLQAAPEALSRPAVLARNAACRVAAPERPAAAPTPPSQAEPSIEDIPLNELFDTYAKGYLSIGTDTETDGWITEVEGTIPKELTGENFCPLQQCTVLLLVSCTVLYSVPCSCHTVRPEAHV